MKSVQFSFLLIFVFLLSCQNDASLSDRMEMNGRINFNSNWKFSLKASDQAANPDYDDAGWRSLDLPHDWAIEGEFSDTNASGTGYLPGGTGWYRKSFRMDGSDKGQTVYILFDGAYQNTEIWINGNYLGKRPFGYISFYYEISPFLNYGTEDNVIAVKVEHEHVADSRWYTGNGIYRNVWLIVDEALHVQPWGTFVSTPSINNDEAIVKINADLVNANGIKGKVISSAFSILDMDGHKIASTSDQHELNGETSFSIETDLNMAHPELWSPDHPYLYEARLDLYLDDKLTDTYITPFGVRYFHFDPDKGFYFNGKNTLLKGVCLHHDLGGFGAARHPEAIEEVLLTLKECGVNAIRTSHNPEDPAFLDMLDRIGFFVMEEAFDEWRLGKKKWIQGRNVGQDQGILGLDKYYSTRGYSDFFDEWAERDIKDIVIRDRNHPSIIMWSIGNEVDFANDPYSDKNDPFYEDWKPDPAELGEIAPKLVAWVKEIDTTRPVTAALANLPVAQQVGYTDALDIVGYNYQEKYYEEHHKLYPERIIYGSENSGSPTSWRAVAENDYISGLFIWTGLDYRGEAGEFPRHSAPAGMVDMCGFKKPGFYFWKSKWIEEPMIALVVKPVNQRWVYAMHWNWQDSPDSEFSIFAVTNCDEAELFLNGSSLGKKAYDPTQLSITWPLDFQPGELKVTGYKDGQPVCEQVLQTAGPPAKLTLECREETMKPDGQDIVKVVVKAVDDEGIVVPVADNLVKFTVGGGAEIDNVCTGDAYSTESYRGDRRSLYMGKCVVYLKSNGISETIQFQAETDGLARAEIEIDVED